VPTAHSALRPVILGPLIFAFITWGVLDAVRRPHRIADRRAPSPHAFAGPLDFTPARFVPLMHDALPEPSLPFRSFARLPSVHVLNLNGGEHVDVRLYEADGSLRADALRLLDRLLCDWGKPDDVRCAEVDRRTIQLVFRAAYHFGRGEIVIISGYRTPRKRSEGPHASGHAIDFKLTGVSLGALSAHVRTFPRAGVGVYSHPLTQYVHLDSRLQSYHWGDSSGPGAPGGEWSLGGLEVLLRQDRAWSPASDWPEGTRPPPRAQRPSFAPLDADDPTSQDAD
jgi:uncharacterized protein YcbK (DUF882 family)